MNMIAELFIEQKIEFKFVLFSIGQTLYNRIDTAIADISHYNEN